MTDTPPDVAAIRARLASITPGPWTRPVANVFRVIAPDAPHTNAPEGMTPPYPWAIVCDVGSESTAAADAEFIALAPETIAGLLDYIESLGGATAPPPRTAEQQRQIEELRAASDAISRPGEGPHRFPGVEAAERGEGFFTSSCAFGCGAWLADARSGPARDRRDPEWETPYGDRRGVGTCPNNPITEATDG